MTFSLRKWVARLNKFWIVLFHTYSSRLKTKSFIITTLIAALLLVGVTNLQTIINVFNNDSANKVAVIDKSDELYQPLEAQLNNTADDLKLVDYQKSEDEAKQAVKEGNFEGYLVLEKSNEGIPQATYKANKISGQEIPGKMQKALQQVKVAVATKQLGLNQQEIAEVYAPVSFQKVALQEGAKTETELNQARALVYALLFLLYFSVLFYGSMIAMEVATEKSSRVMEILISSVSPVKQMFGKILGVALLGITQYAFLIGVGYLSFKFFMSGDMELGAIATMLDVGAIPAGTLVYAAVFFILGYLLYATLLAMLGSLVNRVEEANQMMTPVIMLIVVAFMIAMSGLANPDASFVQITSFIPFFSPMIMFLRVGMGAVPFWEVFLSIGLLVATIILFIYIGARVYRGGVLMYGKTSWKAIRQAFALSKTEK